MIGPIAFAGKQLGNGLRRLAQPESAAEGHWRAIFDNSAVGIAVTLPDGRFAAANRAYQEMVGYSEDELCSMTFMQLTFEADRAANAALVEEARAGKRRQFAMEKRYQRKDGHLIWVKITVSFSPPGIPPFGMAVVEDINERKLAEERLREYEKVVENTQEMIVVVDREYRHLLANQAFLAFRGFRREEVIGHRPTEFTSCELFENVIKPRMEECFQGRVVEFGVHEPTVSMGERDLLVRCFPIEGPQGVDRVAAVMQDITTQKKSNDDLEKSLAQSRALAHQLQRVREEERARLARELHDQLGQALTAIKIDLASLLTDTGGLPNIEKAEPRVRSIMNLVDDTINSVRRIATDLRPGILDDLGLVAAVEWMAEDFQARTGVRCEVSLPDCDPAIDCSRATALVRILQEALTNIARHANATAVNMRLAQEDGGLSLVVHDNGVGIDEERLSAGGSLGLLGMRERVLLLGGSIDIVGNTREGTTVRVCLPTAAQPAQ